MIEVTTYVDGALVDTAEADGPEAALVAARVLWDEMLDGRLFSFPPRVEFRVDGALVRRLERRP
jgi:hypothetical protein